MKYKIAFVDLHYIYKAAKPLLHNLTIKEIDGIRVFCSTPEPVYEVFGDDPDRRAYGEMSKLPNELFLHEFMLLDKGDEQALLEFQNKYGLITSPMRTNIYDLEVAHDFRDFKIPLGSKGEKHGIEESQAVLATVETKNTTCAIASLTEVQATITSLRDLFINLVVMRQEIDKNTYQPFTKDGIGTPRRITFGTGKHKQQVTYTPHMNQDRLKCISEIIGSEFPLIQVVREQQNSASGKTSYLPETVPVPLSMALIIQLVDFLSDDEVIHTCKNPDCPNGGLFQYKRGTGRRSDSLYCSEKCQQQAKSKRQATRKKEARKLKSNNKENTHNPSAHVALHS